MIHAKRAIQVLNKLVSLISDDFSEQSLSAYATAFAIIDQLREYNESHMDSQVDISSKLSSLSTHVNGCAGFRDDTKTVDDHRNWCREALWALAENHMFGSQDF